MISRKQNNKKTCENLKWLRKETHAYIHADLIFGLPSDTLKNFSKSFDKLVGLRPHEIQLGILKRLRGVPLNRHNEEYALRYNPDAPYNILCTRDIDFETMQRVNRFARYWDMIANSGRYKFTLPLILNETPFDNFMKLSDDLYQVSGSTWKISLKRLFLLLYNHLKKSNDESLVYKILQMDYLRTNEKNTFESVVYKKNKISKIGIANKRQQQMLR